MNKHNKVYSFFNRLLITIILTLIVLITCKKSDTLKRNIYKNIYDTNIKFASINKIYKKYFGSSIPFSNIYENKTQAVFEETLSYSELNPYKEGVNISVKENYLVPALTNGLVIFIGNKEDYGNTIIIEDENGIDIYYGNVDNINVKLYEYVTKGNPIAEANNNLYLVFKKDGNVLDYQKYIP